MALTQAKLKKMSLEELKTEKKSNDYFIKQYEEKLKQAIRERDMEKVAESLSYYYEEQHKVLREIYIKKHLK